MPVDLADVAVDAAGSLTPMAARARRDRGRRPVPADVDGDPLRLRQLVTILVDNAVAHTPAAAAR